MRSPSIHNRATPSATPGVLSTVSSSILSPAIGGQHDVGADHAAMLGFAHRQDRRIAARRPSSGDVSADRRERACRARRRAAEYARQLAAAAKVELVVEPDVVGQASGRRTGETRWRSNGNQCRWARRSSALAWAGILRSFTSSATGAGPPSTGTTLALSHDADFVQTGARLQLGAGQRLAGGVLQGKARRLIALRCTAPRLRYGALNRGRSRRRSGRPARRRR